MKKAFLINGTVHLIFAIYLYLGGLGQIFEMRFFSIALLVLALISLIAYTSYEENQFFRYLFLCFMFYNAVLSLVSYSMINRADNSIRYFVFLHLILFIIFFLAYMNASKSADNQHKTE